MALFYFRKIDTTTKDGKAKLIDTFIDIIYLYDDHLKIINNINDKNKDISLEKLKSSNLEMKTFIATYLLDKEGNLLQTDKPMVEKIADKIEYVFDKANDYERIKEKLIGETFEYQPKFDYIINRFAYEV